MLFSETTDLSSLRAECSSESDYKETMPNACLTKLELPGLRVRTSWSYFRTPVLAPQCAGRHRAAPLARVRKGAQVPHLHTYSCSTSGQIVVDSRRNPDCSSVFSLIFIHINLYTSVVFTWCTNIWQIWHNVLLIPQTLSYTLLGLLYNKYLQITNLSLYI